MQAFKLKGKVDQQGHLILAEPINLTPGDVEVIILQSVETISAEPTLDTISTPESVPKRVSRVKVLQDWFENAPPVPPDFDADQAKWEYLKEKHNL